DSIGHAVGVEQGSDRPEEFIFSNGRAGRNVGEHRELKEIALPVEPLTAGQHPRANLSCLLYLIFKGSQAISGGERPKTRGWSHGIAYAQSPHPFHELAFELFRDPAVNNKAFGRNAGLAVVNDTRLHRRFDRPFEIGARHNDKRVATTQLQYRFLDLLACGLRYAPSRADAAGQCHGGYARIGDDLRYTPGINQQGLKSAFRKAGFAENF